MTAKALNAVLEFAVCTDRGMVRSKNEDSVFVDPGLGLAILADGMGGASAGEVASAMATSLLATALKQALARRRPHRRDRRAVSVSSATAWSTNVSSSLTSLRVRVTTSAAILAIPAPRPAIASA